MSIPGPRYHMIRGSQQRSSVLIPMRHEPPIGERLKQNLAAEPLAQEHSRLKGCTHIAVEPLLDLSAIEIGGTRQNRKHSGGLLCRWMLGLEFRALSRCGRMP